MDLFNGKFLLGLGIGLIFFAAALFELVRKGFLSDSRSQRNNGGTGDDYPHVVGNFAALANALEDVIQESAAKPEHGYDRVEIVLSVEHADDSGSITKTEHVISRALTKELLKMMPLKAD